MYAHIVDIAKINPTLFLKKCLRSLSQAAAHVAALAEAVLAVDSAEVAPSAVVQEASFN